MQSLLIKRQWLTKNNSVNPTSTKDERHAFKNDSLNTKPYPTTTSIKSLIPSLSTFNLPPATTTISSSSYCTNSTSDLYSPCSTTTGTGLSLSGLESDNLKPTTTYEAPPPPIFACDQHTPYPTAIDYHGSANLQQFGIQPVKLLLERLESWQNVTKCLYTHFEALAVVESSIVKSYYKLEGILAFENYGIWGNGSQQRYSNATDISDNSYKDIYHVNSLRTHDNKDSNNINIKKKKLSRPTSATLSPSIFQSHFAKTGGIRQLCDSWQMYHLKNAKDHIDYANFIRTQGLPLLSNIKNELKYIILSVRSDDRLSLTRLAKLKEEAAKRLTQLDQQLTFFDRHPDHGDTKEDPWLMNTRKILKRVIKQMLKVHQQENKMHETVIRLQREIMALEKQLMEDLRQFCQQIYKLRESSWLGVDRGLLEIMRMLDTVTNDADWAAFTEQYKGQLVAEDASYRHPDKLQYPNHNHLLVQPLFAARMERKSSVLRNWHEYIYVLTPAGFLHEYRNTKSYPSHPTNTMYIPEYNVITLSTNRHHDLVFQLQPYALAPSFPRLTSSSLFTGRRGSIITNGRSLKRTTANRTRNNITLRAKCAQDMKTWLEHLTICSHRYRSIPQCHRSAGDLVSSVGTFSPTLVNQDMVFSPRWLVSPAPARSSYASNNMVVLCETSPAPTTSGIEEESLPKTTTTATTTVPYPDQYQNHTTLTTGGFSALADFLSFASKQLASDQQNIYRTTTSASSVTEPSLSDKLSSDDTSTTATTIPPLNRKQEIDDRIEPAPSPPKEDPRPSILTGVQCPSAST